MTENAAHPLHSIAVLALALAGCGGGGSDPAPAPPAPAGATVAERAGHVMVASARSPGIAGGWRFVNNRAYLAPALW